MNYMALILAAVALGIAWHTHRKNNELKERLAQLNSRLYHFKRTAQEAHDDLKQEIANLKFQQMKAQGQLFVTGATPIADIMALHPQAEHVLAAYHIGGCASCMVDPLQRLDQAAHQNNQLLEPILIALNNLPAQPQNGSGKHIPPGEMMMASKTSTLTGL